MINHDGIVYILLILSLSSENMNYRVSSFLRTVVKECDYTEYASVFKTAILPVSTYSVNIFGNLAFQE